MIKFHVLASETGRSVSRLIRLKGVGGNLYNAVRWKCLQTTDDTPQPLQCVFKDASNLVQKLRRRMNLAAELRGNASAALSV